MFQRSLEIKELDTALAKRCRSGAAKLQHARLMRWKIPPGCVATTIVTSPLFYSPVDVTVHQKGCQSSGIFECQRIQSESFQ